MEVLEYHYRRPRDILGKCSFAVHVKLTAFVEAGTKWTVGYLTAFALTPGIASPMTRAVFGAGATKKFQFI
jgi:hypothetical protein